MSETPRTDEAEDWDGSLGPYEKVVRADFARILERELRTSDAKILALLDKIQNGPLDQPMPCRECHGGRIWRAWREDVSEPDRYEAACLRCEGESSTRMNAAIRGQKPEGKELPDIES